MRSIQLPPFLEEHRERLVPAAFITVLVLTGAFFLADIWTGGVARSYLCPPAQATCSMADSIGYVHTSSSSGTSMNTTYLTDRTTLELGSLMELLRINTELAPYAQDVNKALTPVTSQIVAAVAADEKVYQLMQKGYASESDLQYVHHRIRLALMTQMERYAQTSLQTESGQLEQKLASVLPTEATSFGLSQIFEQQSTNYIKPGDLFLIENLQVTGTRSEGNIFDTVSVKMTVQTTADALQRLLADINTSGNLDATTSSTPLPLMRVTRLAMSSLGTTAPESSVDTPRTTYRGEIELETYVKSITEEGIKPLDEEVGRLREDAKNKQATALLKPGVETQRIQQLFEIANNGERTLEAARTQKDLRAVQEQLNTLKELYKTIISNYTAS